MSPLLDPSDYVENSPVGVDLLALRLAFLSASAIRSSYLGYLVAQAHRCAPATAPGPPRMADTPTGSASRPRTCGARGRWPSACLPSRPDAAREFGFRVADGERGLALARSEWLRGATSGPTPLPDRADTGRVHEFVVQARRRMASPV